MMKLVKATFEQLELDHIAWDSLRDWVINEAIRLQQIPAPTFAESQRADAVRQQFEALGLLDVRVDELHNVYGRLAGRDSSLPATMISAHTDTVFGAHTDLKVSHQPPRIYGPGLGDNSMGVAAMLGLVKAYREYGIVPDGDVWCVATTGEEGLGDLRGMRLAFDHLRPYIRQVINLEGLAYGHIYHAGIAVERWHITAHTEGGHSWLHFGRNSAIHAIMQLGTRITQLQPPTHPRTTYNIGIIEGGQSINTIAAQAGMWLDLRSETQSTLDALCEQVREIIHTMSHEDLRLEVSVVGKRPTGSISPQHPLVQAALGTLSYLGIHGSLDNASTDGNVPLSQGCPTVTIGITRGGNAHRLDEFIDTTYVADGMKQLLALTLLAAQLPT